MKPEKINQATFEQTGSLSLKTKELIREYHSTEPASWVQEQLLGELIYNLLSDSTGVYNPDTAWHFKGAIESLIELFINPELRKNLPEQTIKNVSPFLPKLHELFLKLTQEEFQENLEFYSLDQYGHSMDYKEILYLQEIYSEKLALAKIKKQFRDNPDSIVYNPHRTTLFQSTT